MLILLRSHLHFSELVQRSAWAHPAHGIDTRLLAKRTVVSCVRHRKTSWSKTSTSFARTERLYSRVCCPLLRGTRKLHASQGHSWVRRIRQLQYRHHSKRRFVRDEAVHYVMSASRCAVLVFKRNFCIPLPASSMVRVAGLVAAHLSVRLKSTSLQLGGELDHEDGIPSRLTAVLAQQRMGTILLQVAKKRVRLAKFKGPSNVRRTRMAAILARFMAS